MEHGRSVLKFEANDKTGLQDSTNYICTRCGKPFASPIFAVNNSPGIAEGYYACPTCLSKVEIKKEDKEAREAKAPLIEPEPEVEAIQQQETVEEVEEPAMVEMKEEEPAPSSSSPASPVCQHYMGYLKKRPKGAPMPDECYTCALMLDCSH
jgi:DNA-directed RNA polymerase subunit RPC12/RpoP